MYKLKVFRKIMFGLPLSEANFEVRKFQKGEVAQERLELVAKVVLRGYNTALEKGLSRDLLTCVETKKKDLVGFFNEGIGMGLFTLDLFSLRKRNRFWEFIKDKGKHHEYMSYIGAGIAFGVFKIRSIKRFIKKASPTSGLLLLNGIGFYYAYFKPNKTLNKFFIPSNLTKDDFHVECYGNGIGRALWFYHGANPESIAQTIQKFPKSRRAGIWAGVGLAATYAGGVLPEKIQLLKELSNEYYLSLGEGAILASHTRDIAGNSFTDESTINILTKRSMSDCNKYAIEANNRLEGRQFINERHSLDVFFEELRDWVEISHLDVKNLAKEEVIKEEVNY